MLRQVYTRLYFSDEAANSADPILTLVPADRRATLIATRQPGSGNAIYADIHMQGDDRVLRRLIHSRRAFGR
jgi:protocatechuate 3,4-dioxygenase alpha subunit